MSAFTVDGGYDTAHVPASANGYVEARNRRAAINLAAFAIDHNRPTEWLGGMLDILGLRHAADEAKVKRPTPIEPGGSTYAQRLKRGTQKSCGTPAGFAFHSRHNTTPCDDCTQANEDRQRNIPHGTKNAYANHGCRCGSCTAANTAATARRRMESAS